MRMLRRRRERILNIMIIFVSTLVIGFGINLIPSYDSQLEKGETKITIVNIEKFRSSMVQLKTDDKRIVYTHEVNAPYIVEQIKKGHDTFDITVSKNNRLIYMTKIRPKYEITTLGADY